MIFSPFSYRNIVVEQGPPPTPTPTPSQTPSPTPTPSVTPTPTITPTPSPTTVTWKYRYIASADGTTRPKTASNLSFIFNGVTYTRSNQTFTSSVNNIQTITTDTNTATGQFDIYRDLCRGTTGTGTPRLDQFTVKVFKNGTAVYNNNTDITNIVVPTCPTQDSRNEGSTTITVSAGDEIIVEWTDNLTV